MNDWLWTELHHHFDTDDGSLPEVHVNCVDKQAVVTAFAQLRSRGKDVTHQGAKFWSVTHSKDCPLESLPNAAALVVLGEAEPIHFVLRDIDVGGVRLPDLGVSVFADQIALDYRMGPEWRAIELRVLFRLLLDLARLDHESSVTLEPHVLPEVAEHFQTCWSRFVSEDGTSSSIAPTAAGQVSRPMITMHSVQVSSVAQFLPDGPSVRGSADAVSARVLCRKSLHAHDLQA
jgi:hypothetical protein